MSKSELKRQCVMNPLEMAEKITELTNKLAAAEARLVSINEMRINDYALNGYVNYFRTIQVLSSASGSSALDAMLAKERQAGRDEVLKEFSAQEPAGYFQLHNGLYEQVSKKHSADYDVYAMLIRPQPPKEQS